MRFKIILLANILIFIISCNKTNNSVDSKYTDPIKYYKDYWPNESGNLDSTEKAIHDFASDSECFDCHGQYFAECLNLDTHIHLMTQYLKRVGMKHKLIFLIRGKDFVFNVTHL